MLASDSCVCHVQLPGVPGASLFSAWWQQKGGVIGGRMQAAQSWQCCHDSLYGGFTACVPYLLSQVL